MESGHNKISEPHHLDRLKMLNASVRDGQWPCLVETRAGQKIWVSGKLHENIKILSKTTWKEEHPRRAAATRTL